MARQRRQAHRRPVDRPERFLVWKVGAEFLVAARDIEWLEAAENYVNLHVRGRVYPLRSTMTAIQDRLDPQRFVRVHRSYMVNLDFLVQGAAHARGAPCASDSFDYFTPATGVLPSTST